MGDQKRKPMQKFQSASSCDHVKMCDQQRSDTSWYELLTEEQATSEITYYLSIFVISNYFATTKKYVLEWMNVIQTVLGKITFKSNVLRYCVKKVTNCVP